MGLLSICNFHMYFISFSFSIVSMSPLFITSMQFWLCFLVVWSLWDPEQTYDIELQWWFPWVPLYQVHMRWPHPWMTLDIRHKSISNSTLKSLLNFTPYPFLPMTALGKNNTHYLVIFVSPQLAHFKMTHWSTKTKHLMLFLIIYRSGFRCRAKINNSSTINDKVPLLFCTPSFVLFLCWVSIGLGISIHDRRKRTGEERA